jgi:diaminohydroxyphosphoribosylaminopyrimidine deaminase / 5-amino-6-(5-phosphoribosylamino)uracil reductase
MSSDTFMSRAIELAGKVDLSRDLNPRVGAVIVDASGNVVGEGWHEGSGTAHAEVMAIAQAGTKSVGATLYCTLEPCNAQGKTGPCTQAVIAAGITKVVIAQTDPHQAMSGGVKTLQDAGIEVEVGVLKEQATLLNASWNFAQQNNRPWVIWKTATTLDGFVAAEDGTSKWITGEPCAGASARDSRERWRNPDWHRNRVSRRSTTNRAVTTCRQATTSRNCWRSRPAS